MRVASDSIGPGPAPIGGKSKRTVIVYMAHIWRLWETIEQGALSLKQRRKGLV